MGRILTGPIFSMPSYIHLCSAGMNPPLACTATLRGRSDGTTTRLRSDTSAALPVKDDDRDLLLPEAGDDTVMDANCAAMAEAAAADAISSLLPLSNPCNCSQILASLEVSGFIAFPASTWIRPRMRKAVTAPQSPPSLPQLKISEPRTLRFRR